jgi:nitrogen fixation protein NifB
MEEVDMDTSLNKQQLEKTTTVSHFFPKEIQDRIAEHPCYSKQAHQFARMHLPVAPACNIQCNYCNRKYDCSNESRPGVVSKLVDPDLGLKQFNAIKKRAPNLKVVGIAGPGDALANPSATFATLAKIQQAEPDVQLCISTNGLMLEQYVDKLVEFNVHHLTITINCIDPEIGQKIYPWIYYENRRLRGVEASQRLITNQLAGLKKAADAGLLVKVNTVLIPGVNDHHIEAVSQAVKTRGALLHNIMPLISEPEHGTYFGLTGQRGPTFDEIERARSFSGSHMPQMTHCQQCRADAVGTLGGCSSDSTATPNKIGKATVTKPYRVAVASNGESLISTHFGHATIFEIYQYDATSAAFHFIEPRDVENYCSGQSECLDQEAEKDKIIQTIADCDLVLCARIGITPWRSLEKIGVQPNVDFAMQETSDALLTLAALMKKMEHVTRPNVEQEARYEIRHNR